MSRGAKVAIVLWSVTLLVISFQVGRLFGRHEMLREMCRAEQLFDYVVRECEEGR